MKESRVLRLYYEVRDSLHLTAVNDLLTQDQKAAFIQADLRFLIANLTCLDLVELQAQLSAAQYARPEE
jgi:hypothetical protein